MDRIEQGIREFLLESYLYRESTGEALLTDDHLLRKSILRRAACKAAARSGENHIGFFRQSCSSPIYKLNQVKIMDLASLEDHYQMILMNELQKMKTE